MLSPALRGAVYRSERGWAILAADIIRDIRRWHCPMASRPRKLHLQIPHSETNTSPSEQSFLQPRPVGFVQWCSLEQGSSPTAAQQSARSRESGAPPDRPGAQFMSRFCGSIIVKTPHEQNSPVASQCLRSRIAAWLRHTTDDAGFALTPLVWRSPPALRTWWSCGDWRWAA